MVFECPELKARLSIDTKNTECIFKNKTSKCVQSLVNHPLWDGSLGAFQPFDANQAVKHLFSCELDFNGSSDIWIHALWENSLRWGASNFALPGMPAIHFSFQKDIWYYVFKISDFLVKNSLSMNSLMEHVETKEGRTWMEESCTLHHVVEGDSGADSVCSSSRFKVGQVVDTALGAVSPGSSLPRRWGSRSLACRCVCLADSHGASSLSNWDFRCIISSVLPRRQATACTCLRATSRGPCRRCLRSPRRSAWPLLLRSVVSRRRAPTRSLPSRRLRMASQRGRLPLSSTFRA